MRVYQWLLRLYPSSFRAEYGGEMRAIFRRRLREAGSPAARAALWLEVLADTIANASRVHVDILRQDLRYGTRSLRRSPGFTLTVIAVAALGIGATTATFSLADHVFLRPLPFREPDRLVLLWQDQSWRGYPTLELSPPNFLDWRRASRSFEMMGAYTTQSANLVGAGEPQRLTGVAITTDVLPSLGVSPTVGRTFSSADEDPAAPATVILSNATWRRLFNADPGIVGRHVLLDDQPSEVIGVMPPAFQFPERDTQFWTVLRFSGGGMTDRTNYSLYGIGRLAPGVTIDQARTDLQSIAARLEREYPKENEKTGAVVQALRDRIPWRSRTLLLALAGAGLCVLLIACVNLANLLIARALARQRELAVRAAIGAGADRLLRQLFTESLLLTLTGGVAGLLLAHASAPLLARLVPTALPMSEAPPLDGRVLLLSAVVTLLTGIGFGLLPAARATRTLDLTAFHEGARSGSNAGTRRLRAALVAFEIAASVVLLVGSGLLLRALWRVQDTDPGFDTKHVITMRTWLPAPKYSATAAREAFYRDVLARIRRLPGVQAAGYISYLPMTFRGGIWPVTAEGADKSTAAEPSASLRYVTPGFFDALGMRIVRGRAIADTDTQKAPFVAVVSESFAERIWPRQDPIGRRFEFAFAQRTVVGVVNDVRVRGLERISEPQVYLPSAQVEDGWLLFFAPKDLAVKAAGPGAVTGTIRRIIAAVDPQQPISDVRMLEEILAADTGPRRAQVRVLIVFAALAFALAALGVHGVLSFVVASQTREIGVRMALGATRIDVMRLVLGRSAVLTVAGVAAGTALAYAAARAMESVLAGISPGDAATFAAAIAVTMMMALLGSLLPTARAMGIDPRVAMSVE
jgi:putative ABC transport system permease protein